MSNEKRVLKLGDDTLSMIRELLQLALLTGTNVVDHYRLLELEIDDATGKIVPTTEYIEKYNLTVQTLSDKATELQAQMEAMETETTEEAN